MRRPGAGLAYCLGPLKRGFDVIAALLALLALSPLLAALALLVRLIDGRPVLFAQERSGLRARPFRPLKYRTMRQGDARGLPITGRGDARVTALGRLLRAAKLDELPQLLNVLRGEMSIVGPRPEIPRYVALYDAAQRRVLQVRPGLTDPASLRYRDEEALLGSVDEARRESFYTGDLLPKKLDLSLRYIEDAGFWYDLGVVVRTALAILLPGRA